MASATSPIPSYAKPPIIEAVWSVQFGEMAWLLPPHTGLLWSRLRERFPNCEEQPPIGHVVERDEAFSAPLRGVEMRAVPPLSRQWFVSDSSNQLIQVQRDRFCCNWRKVNPADVYPRYHHMREMFRVNWMLFCEFVAEMEQSPPAVDQCEMTYINHVDRGHGWDSMEQVGEVFPMLQWQHEASYLPEPETLGAKASFAIPDLAGRLHASLRHGARTTESSSEEQQLLVLEVTARGRPEKTDVDGLLSWYALAREVIVRGFTDLTGPAMHARWEREQ